MKKHHKPFSEAHQTQIGVLAVVLIIAGLVYIFGYLLPAETVPPSPKQQATRSVP